METRERFRNLLRFLLYRARILIGARIGRIIVARITEWIDGTKNDKLDELIVYVSGKSKDDPCFGAVKLNKILFLADFLYYAITGGKITNSIYVHRGKGPTPKYMKQRLEALGKADKIKIEETPYFSYTQKRVIPLVEPNLSVFSTEEVRCVDAAIDALRPYGALELSNWTHELIPWLLTGDEETIPYETAFVLNNKPVGKSGIEWARRELERLANK